MKLKKLVIFLGTTAFLLGFIGASSAIALSIPTDLAVDFRKPAWNPVSNTDEFTRMGITVKADGEDGAYLSWSSSGFGIIGGEIDDHNSPVFDTNPKIDGDDDGDSEQEFKVYFPGYVNFDGLWLTGFSGDEDDLELELKLNSGSEGVSLGGLLTRDGDLVFIDLSGFTFRKLDIEGVDSDTMFYVAGFEGDNSNPVPEPATMLLLGIGLVGLAGFRRKKILR